MCIYTILSLLIIFILISSVNAADINADATDLTSLSGNDEIVCVQNEFDVLGIDTSTFSELSGEIGPGGNITLLLFIMVMIIIVRLMIQHALLYLLKKMLQ